MSESETGASAASEAPLDLELVKQALREVLDEASAPPMTARFEGGTMILKPADESLQPREIPIREFYKKIVRVRDQLRVLEQKVNQHKTLSESDKSQLQGYITRSYGALTSFNLLFRNKDDQFKGQRGK